MPRPKTLTAITKAPAAIRSSRKKRIGSMATTGKVANHLDQAKARWMDSCHGNGKPVREIAISKFKATCLAELESVRRTRTPIRITRFGKPIADILPPTIAPQKSWLGCMEDTMKIVGDIVGPVGAFDGWDPD
ncbi:MAG: hypothetical protein ABI972_02950 [Acidobacteriota bacterium]